MRRTMENKQNSGFMGGLVVGIILGASVVFLLGTKKGKKILDTLTEEGLEGFDELGELLEDTLEQKPAPKVKKTTVENVATNTIIPVVAEQARSATRRLFKGIPRRRAN